MQSRSYLDSYDFLISVLLVTKLHNQSHPSVNTNTQKHSFYLFLASRIVPITYILLPLLDQMNSTTQVVTEEQDLHVFILDDQELRWFSVGIFKY